MVSTSAARVTGLRHSAWLSLRIDEIITPAWLIPTQNTKLAMKNPHITGLFRPVTPSPWLIIHPKAPPAVATIRARMATVRKNHLGWVSTPLRSSRFISESGTGTRSCIKGLR